MIDDGIAVLDIDAGAFYSIDKSTDLGITKISINFSIKIICSLWLPTVLNIILRYDPETIFARIGGQSKRMEKF